MRRRFECSLEPMLDFIRNQPKVGYIHRSSSPAEQATPPGVVSGDPIRWNRASPETWMDAGRNNRGRIEEEDFPAKGCGRPSQTDVIVQGVP